MDDAFLAQLRCPLDPLREATLSRDEQQLVCSRCAVRFPVKQGLPVLVPPHPGCHLDPAREATSPRDEQQLVCSRCGLRFPVKQGLPVLVPDEGELPPGTREVSQLPCQRAANRRKNRN